MPNLIRRKSRNDLRVVSAAGHAATGEDRIRRGVARINLGNGDGVVKGVVKGVVDGVVDGVVNGVVDAVVDGVVVCVGVVVGRFNGVIDGFDVFSVAFARDRILAGGLRDQFRYLPKVLDGVKCEVNTIAVETY